MSGGYFNYIDSQFKSELFGWTDKPGNVLEKYKQTAIPLNLDGG